MAPFHDTVTTGFNKRQCGGYDPFEESIVVGRVSRYVMIGGRQPGVDKSLPHDGV